MNAEFRSVLRDSCGRISIDNAASSGQHAFQAVLATFLLSTDQHPHPLQAPIGASMSSTSAYVNTVHSRPDRLDVHTNTACRVASRFLPLLTDTHGPHGIPGLRLDGIGRRRLRFVHLPTGGRLDLIDSCHSPTDRRRDFAERFRLTTQWQQERGFTRLWGLAELHPSETLLERHWQPKPCMLLRSALMTRAALLWNELDIRPSWTEEALRHLPELAWDSSRDRPGAHEVGTALTETPARIPGARYEPVSDRSGLLSLSGAAIWLHAR
ncbi:hypothetical protein ACTWJ8_40625 (plasmid) [Streptomyces sp. SDT5-1]|uniref:hypothetical protein n=1 Tax=Streptomyces sp. SDT5-1 TaxID=3406418 RepID=UPI003FD36BD3